MTFKQALNAVAQLNDPESEAYRTSITNLTWEYVPININTQVLCNVSTGRPRPFVPTSFRRKIFDVVHGHHIHLYVPLYVYQTH